MTNSDLIEMLQEDLKNERKHMLFYLQASVMVQSLHREELREFLAKEARDEMTHVEQFSELIVHLGGVPNTEHNLFPGNLNSPESILGYAVEIEQEVATNYTRRLQATENYDNPQTAYVHLFYEDQLLDSQRTAWELSQMLKGN